MTAIFKQNQSLPRKLIRISCIFFFFGLIHTVAFADDQRIHLLDKAFKIIDGYRQKLSEGKELSKEEWKALEILQRAQQKEDRKSQKRASAVVYQDEPDQKYGRYEPIEGTQSALGFALGDDVSCEQRLIENKDGSTFTYLRKTKENYIEKWVFLKNANPFFRAYYWEDVAKRLREMTSPENSVNYQLPPSRVLIEIATLAKICPVEVSLLTGTDIKIFNMQTVVPYWTNEEYFFTGSDTTRYAATVSLYYAKRGHQNKNDFALIWPCYLEYRKKE